VPQLLDDVLAAVEPALGPAAGEPVPLDGGLTNRNYRVRLAHGDYVIRLPGDDTAVLGIDRLAERAATEAAADAGVGPEVAAFEHGCLVTRFIEGRPLSAAELRSPQRLAVAAAALRAVHAGPPLPAAFNGFRVVEAYREAALERGGTVPDAYDRAHELAERIEAALTGPEHAPVPCHDDLLAANLLWDGHRIRIVDWEYAGMGDRFFDLGNLAVNNEFGPDEERALIAAYFEEPVTARRLAALRLQRLMSDFREAMWGVLQAAVSSLDVDFRAYAHEHFDRLLAALDDAPVDRWLSEAARAA
jgi:thiamine kinase-like enzyme